LSSELFRARAKDFFSLASVFFAGPLTQGPKRLAASCPLTREGKCAKRYGGPHFRLFATRSGGATTEINTPAMNAKLDPRNQHGLSVAGFNVMLRLDRSIHWVTMPFFAVDSAVEPQNDTLWKGFNAGFFATDCQLENCGSSLAMNGGVCCSGTPLITP